MSRPLKLTVDYFTHDSDASDGKTVSILENHFGPEGYATWFKLLERISKTNNQVINLRNGEETEFLAAKLRLKPERLLEILNKMADLEAIDKDLWLQSKVIWIQNFVDRLKPVYESRHQELPSKPVVSLPRNPVSCTDNTVSLPDNSQTKLKETKLKETKEKKIVPFPEFSNVSMLQKEYDKLRESFGGAAAKDKCEALSLYKKSKGVSYKDDYATILTWHRNDLKKGAKDGVRNAVNQRGARKLIPRDQYTRPESLRIDFGSAGEDGDGSREDVSEFQETAGNSGSTQGVPTPGVRQG